MNGRCIKHLPSDSEMNFVLLWNMDKLADSYKLIMQVCQKYGLQLFTKICVTLNIATSWSISKESDYSKDRLSFRYYLLKHFFSFFCFYNQCWNIFLQCSSLTSPLIFRCVRWLAWLNACEKYLIRVFLQVRLNEMYFVF